MYIFFCKGFLIWWDESTKQTKVHINFYIHFMLHMNLINSYWESEFLQILTFASRTPQPCSLHPSPLLLASPPSQPELQAFCAASSMALSISDFTFSPTSFSALGTVEALCAASNMMLSVSDLTFSPTSFSALSTVEALCAGSKAIRLTSSSSSPVRYATFQKNEYFIWMNKTVLFCMNEILNLNNASWKKMNIFFEWIFFHKKLNELLNEWQKCVIHRKNENNVKKKTSSLKKVQQSMKNRWKCEKRHTMWTKYMQRNSQSSNFGQIKNTPDHWAFWIIFLMRHFLYKVE